MVYETEKRSNLYMERSSPGIFGVIQIHVGDSLGLVNPSEHKEKTRGRL